MRRVLSYLMMLFVVSGSPSIAQRVADDDYRDDSYEYSSDGNVWKSIVGGGLAIAMIGIIMWWEDYHRKPKKSVSRADILYEKSRAGLAVLGIWKIVMWIVGLVFD